jgi:hypothetical protein
MSIPLCGRFDYVAVVPESVANRASWKVRLCRPVELTGDDLMDDRLVGHSPTLEISDAGITPDVRIPPLTGRARPRVLRSRMTLTAANSTHARVASVAFHLDQALTMVLSPRDALFMARTGCGGLGVSIVRDGQLIAAAGAVSAVPLGELVHVRLPSDTLAEAEAVFRKHDPEFAFPEWPVEIRFGGQTRVLYGGRPQLQSYKAWVEHGFYRGIPGTDECVAIWLAKACPEIPAIASAQLLDAPDPLEIVPWSAKGAV